MQAILGAFLIVGLICLYFLPAIIASNIKHKNKDAIGVLNLLLGWTFIGWVIALIWSISN
jgi:hypothetical protein